MKARMGGTCIPYSFFNLEFRCGWVVKTTTPPLYSWGKEAGTQCTGGWVGPMSSRDGRGKSIVHQDSIPGPSNP